MTMDKLKVELDHAVHGPVLTNLFVPPIRNRIDMLTTGIKSPIGIMVLGANVDTLQTVADQIEVVARSVPGACRGDKRTRRVWNEMAGATQVVQKLVTPSERRADAQSPPLKIDIRCYTHRGKVLLYAARIY